jgi:uncharacterized membrane protein YozB (DUF420 family)
MPNQPPLTALGKTSVRTGCVRVGNDFQIISHRQASFLSRRRSSKANAEVKLTRGIYRRTPFPPPNTEVSAEYCQRSLGEDMNGFLGTQAGFAADLNLILQLAMGIALLAGTYLARQKRFGAHGLCQASVLVLNLPLLALMMWPVFRIQVMPRLAAHLTRRYYFVAALHGGFGMLAELLGFYLFLVCCTSLIPQWLRIQNWKLWMRIELAVWWTTVVAGVGVYFVWYVLPARR